MTNQNISESVDQKKNISETETMNSYCELPLKSCDQSTRNVISSQDQINCQHKKKTETWLGPVVKVTPCLD